MKAETKVEKSLLLYLETCAVDYGTVEPIRMNKDDWDVVKVWNHLGYINLKRRKLNDIPKHSARTHFITLSDETFDEAHQLRRERAERLKEKGCQPSKTKPANDTGD